MANLLKFSREARETILQLNNNALGRDINVSIALARAIAAKYPIPGERQENPKIFFFDSYSVPIHNILYSINELFIIDVEFVFNLVSDFYLSRYKACYQDEYIIMNNNKHPLANFFNLSDSISNKILEAIHADGNKIMVLHNNIMKVINELGAEA